MINKSETAVIGSLPVDVSALLSDEQKAIVKEKLSNRINSEGCLQVKSQVAQDPIGQQRRSDRKDQ